MYKVDLHTHSVASPDGSIKPEHYAKVLENEVLDFIAVTDHDRIDFAAGLNKALGERIIVGEEITTKEGEIIGLFLTEAVAPGQTGLETVQAIKSQGGIVYIPHPFETVRKGVLSSTLENIASYVDIIEIGNGRAFVQNQGPKALAWARLNNKSCASSSDAHGVRGLGYFYNVVDKKPEPNNLTSLLSASKSVQRRTPLHTLLYPKFNRLRKKVSTS